MQMENIVTGSHHQLIGANIFATCDTIILRIQPGKYENDELCDFCLISVFFLIVVSPICIRKRKNSDWPSVMYD